MNPHRCRRLLLALVVSGLVLSVAAPVPAGVVSTVGGYIKEYEVATGDLDTSAQLKAALNCLALAVALADQGYTEEATETYRSKCRRFEDQPTLVLTSQEALAKGLIHLLGALIRLHLP